MSLFEPFVPLLIPSFSSKGNLFVLNSKGQYVSDNYDLPQALNVRISKSYLISAYDIYYGFMPQEPSDWPYTEYLFIDSGGYETNDSFDLSERNKFNYKVFPWDQQKMEVVYKKAVACPKFENSNIILSVFDGHGTFDQQLQSALNFQSRFPGAFTNFLIKMNFPVNDLLHGLEQNGGKLELFPILGFTEKELGGSLQERLLNLVSIRHLLTACGWHGHIHIFGGLEPNLVRLFYSVGADIFDGLSWQRIRYQNNSTLFAPDRYVVSQDEFTNKYLMMIDNLAYMQGMSSTLSVLERNLQKNATTLREILTARKNIRICDLLEILGV